VAANDADCVCGRQDRVGRTQDHQARCASADLEERLRRIGAALEDDAVEAELAAHGVDTLTT
jgi:hypothetical protein